VVDDADPPPDDEQPATTISEAITVAVKAPLTPRFLSRIGLPANC
jgi:hypothetical protein